MFITIINWMQRHSRTAGCEQARRLVSFLDGGTASLLHAAAVFKDDSDKYVGAR